MSARLFVIATFVAVLSTPAFAEQRSGAAAQQQNAQTLAAPGHGPQQGPPDGTADDLWHYGRARSSALNGASSAPTHAGVASGEAPAQQTTDGVLPLRYLFGLTRAHAGGAHTPNGRDLNGRDMNGRDY